ncbi:MAG: lipid-transfer protein [Lautropia sp.]
MTAPGLPSDADLARTRSVLDAAAISGIGWTPYCAASGVSLLDLASTACRQAIDDAGLRVADVDGIVCYHMNDSALSRDVAAALGIPALNWWNDSYAGGSHTCRIVAEAALAVGSGLARHVVCYRALNGRSGFRMGQLGAVETGGVFQFMTPYGFGAPPQIFGMIARRHMHEYGTTREQMGRVAITMRAHAVPNERATRRTPMTMDDYLGARMIAEPYGLLDCCQETDGGCALVVSAADRAADGRWPRVRISGVVHGGGRGARLPLDRAPSLTESAFTRLSQRLYRQCGFGPEAIQVAELYDAFTFEVILQLEDFGFCGKGEGGPFVADGHIALGGRLPVNTHGGLLSEAYIQGLNSVVEAVAQVRGQAGARQVPDVEHALVTGFGFSAGGAMVLSRW